MDFLFVWLSRVLYRNIGFLSKRLVSYNSGNRPTLQIHPFFWPDFELCGRGVSEPEQSALAGVKSSTKNRRRSAYFLFYFREDREKGLQTQTQDVLYTRNTSGLETYPIISNIPLFRRSQWPT